MNILVIDLNIIPCQCGICDAQWDEPRSNPMYGVARYEDEVVPDAYEGEWGGMMVCKSCFNTERELHRVDPGAFLSFQAVRHAKGVHP